MTEKKIKQNKNVEKHSRTLKRKKKGFKEEKRNDRTTYVDRVKVGLCQVTFKW